MRGLTYVIVGQERHTGTADVNRGTRKVRLADAVSFLFATVCCL